jgi:hypothetical protein
MAGHDTPSAVTTKTIEAICSRRGAAAGSRTPKYGYPNLHVSRAKPYANGQLRGELAIQHWTYAKYVVGDTGIEPVTSSV